MRDESVEGFVRSPDQAGQLTRLSKVAAPRAHRPAARGPPLAPRGTRCIDGAHVQKYRRKPGDQPDSSRQERDRTRNAAHLIRKAPCAIWLTTFDQEGRGLIRRAIGCNDRSQNLSLWRLYVEQPGNGPPAGSCVMKSVSESSPKIDPRAEFQYRERSDDWISRADDWPGVLSQHPLRGMR
jgi:hypothetical protein